MNRTESSRADAGDGRTENSHVLREQKLRQLGVHIFQRAEDNPSMSDKDRRIVACNLFTLIEDLKTRDINMAHVMKKANLSNPGESTKRLFLMTLDPRAVGTPSSEKREVNLQRKTKNYIKLAKQLAQAFDLTDEAFAVHVFQGSSYADPDGGSSEEFVDISAIAVADCLREMASYLTQKHRLKSYFAAIDRLQVPVTYLDPEKDLLGDWRAQDRDVLNADIEFSYAGEIGGIPSVRLFRQSLGDFDGARLRISKRSYPNDAQKIHELGEVAWQETVPASLELWRDVRLSFAPLLSYIEPKLVFEKRYLFMIRTEAEVFDLRQRYVSINDGYPIPLSLEERCKIGLLEDGGCKLLTDLEPMGSVESHYTWFAEVRGSSCDEHLSVPPYDVEVAEWLSRAITDDTLFPKHAVGSMLEDAVYDGSLETQFEAEILRRKEQVESFENERQDRLAARMEAARRRWTHLSEENEQE